jgi:hypothetical protein
MTFEAKALSLLFVILLQYLLRPIYKRPRREHARVFSCDSEGRVYQLLCLAVEVRNDAVREALARLSTLAAPAGLAVVSRHEAIVGRTGQGCRDTVLTVLVRIPLSSPCHRLSGNPSIPQAI